MAPCEHFRKKIPTLSTERLNLRALTKEDTAAYLALRTDAVVLESTGLAVYQPGDTERAERFITRAMNRFERGSSICWGIFLAESGWLLGIIYETIQKRHRRAAIGYYSSQKAWGNGYMSEALGAIVACNFDRIGLDRQQAWVFLDNFASARVLEKNGFKFEGTLREYVHHPDGTNRDVWMFARTRSK